VKTTTIQTNRTKSISTLFLQALLAILAVCLLCSDVLSSSDAQVSAMHIMEGYLPAGWCIAWGALCIPFLIVGAVSLKRKIAYQGKVKLLIALSAAFVFIISSLKIPSVAGSCSHATGTGLGAILFGPSMMSILGIIVLLFQALLLAHGGLTTLGANTFSMAIFGPFVSYGLFKLLKKCKVPVSVAVFVGSAVGDMATYCLTSVQLAAAYPGDNFWASFGKFIAIFAPTQLPIAIAEGILSVIVYGVVQKNCVKELQALSVVDTVATERVKLWKRNLLLAIGVILLVTIPLALLGGTEFGGTDDAASDMIETITNGTYTTWFDSIWTPPSGEIESLLFCVQAAIGAGICGFVLGRISKKKD
jgi:cobalt/nickel transport system permease protein